MMKEGFLARGNTEKDLQMNGQMMATDLMMLAATAAAGKNRFNRMPLEVYHWRRRG